MAQKPYWKPNILALIEGDISPDSLAEWDEESESYYFPNDWQQYDGNDVDRIYAEWCELHPNRE